jgi:hypothetical protein
MSAKLFVIAAFDFKRLGVDMKAGASAWLDSELACALADKGAVNIPRPQPAAPADSNTQPK